MEINSIITGKKGVSLPFTDYCNPIVDRNIQFQDLLDDIVEYGKKCGWKSLELRSVNNLLPSTMPSITYLGHILDLSQNEEQVFSHFRDSTKRNIRKAIRDGVEVKTSHSWDSVQVFCKLNGMTRKEHGLPPQPYHFFKKVYDHIISKNLGFAVNAFFEEKPIASSIYFHFGKKAIYKYGASDKRYQHFRANNLVMWEAIKWCCKNGFKTFCFGRTDLEHQGLKQFKAGWNTKEDIVKYYRYDLRKDIFIRDHQKVNKLYQDIFRKIPIPLLNMIGSLFYRHVG